MRAAVLLIIAGVSAVAHAAQPTANSSEWRVFITNDNCPDYTWGLTEAQTRKAFADIVKAHLDEMKRTDAQPFASRNRYNMAVTQEAMCFVEAYPGRKDELIARIKDGRIFVSPFLCNSLWGFQSTESAIRTLYPARRLERQWGIPKIESAEHIELPSLPWGTATILSGCGIRWLSNPFYAYDSTFGGLKNPPLFILEGPDGSQLRVVMDRWASGRSSYTQGANILSKPDSLAAEWLPHYAAMGKAYPAGAILASGTHGDISPGSGGQARGFADAIINYNARAGAHPTLVNATLPLFCEAIDQAQAKTPFLEVVRGDFGHSWELWPVSLAKYAADMRNAERTFLSAESLVAVASQLDPRLPETTRSMRERAEWSLAMLSDHAWNGTDARNKRHNAELRRKWARDLEVPCETLLLRSLDAVRFTGSDSHAMIFNGMSIPRAGLVGLPAQGNLTISAGDRPIPSQVISEEGASLLCFLSPELPPYSFLEVQIGKAAKPAGRSDRLRVSPGLLESPSYRLTIDGAGAITSTIHKPTGRELIADAKGRTLCQSIYFDGREHAIANGKSEVVAEGPVLARLRLSGRADGIDVSTFVTVYAEHDLVDFDVRIRKPATTVEQRLCQVFPILRDGDTLRIETTGAVIRPKLQPAGDLLPGADMRRFAVQGFVDASGPDGTGVTIATVDAFALRLDLDPITFEALGNDQNYKEVVRDQHGVSDFRFRYSLRAHAAYDNAAAVAFSRAEAAPLLGFTGRIDTSRLSPPIRIDPARAIALCYKPADDGNGLVLRVWETAGRAGPMDIAVPSFTKATRTDLLERDLEQLRIVDGKTTIDLKPNGFAAVRLIR